MTFTIVCDAAADLPQEFLDKDDIFIIPTFVILEGKEYLDHEVPVEDLLNEFSKGKFSSTSQPSPEQFKKGYGRAVNTDNPVLGIHISSKLSGTFNGARIAIQVFEGADIRLFDTENVSLGAGYFVLMAIKLRDMGYNRDEVEQLLIWARSRVHLQILIDDLEYLKRGGRVNIGQYWLLKLLRMKPIITNHNGKLIRDSFKWGLDGAVKKLAKSLLKYEDFGSHRFIGIGHVNTPQILKEMENIVKDMEHDDFMNIRITATLLSHTGPRAFGMMVAPALKSLTDLDNEISKN